MRKWGFFMLNLFKKASAVAVSLMMSMSGCLTSVSAQTIQTPVNSSIQIQNTTSKAVKPKTNTKQIKTNNTNKVTMKKKNSVGDDAGCYISDFGIKKMTDGTANFDADDNAGNDSSKSNKIVRSFDYINYDLEYVTAISDKTKVVNEAYVDIEFSLDKDPSKAVFNSDSFSWCENPVTTYYYEDGTNSTKWNQSKTVVKQVLTGRRKITNNSDTNAIPGIGTLSFGVYVKGDTNEDIIQPEFKCWIEGNDIVQTCQSDAVTVSAAPRYNIRLVRNTASGNCDPITYLAPDLSESSLEDKDGYLKGRMESYVLQVELLNKETDKGLKGVELPSGDITFDIKATETVNGEDKTSSKDYSPILWDYRLNYPTQTGMLGRDMGPSGDTYVLYCPSSSPFGRTKYYQRDFRSTWDSGNYSMTDNGNGNISVTLKDYSFDLDKYFFPTGVPWTNSSKDIAFQKNHGIFSVGYFQVFCQFPRNVDTTSNLLMNVKVQNFNATSLSGQKTTSEMETGDNQASNVVTLYPVGSYSSRQIWPSTTYYGGPDGTASPGEELYNGNRQYLYGGISYFGDRTLTSWHFLQRFDDKVFEPCEKGVDGVAHKSGNQKNVAGDVTILYAAKPDKTGWTDDNEQNKFNEENLIYFDSLKELQAKGYTCVAYLVEVKNGKYFSADSTINVYFNLKVKDDAKPGKVAMVKSSSRAWTQKEGGPSWKEYKYKNQDGIYGLGSDDFTIGNGKYSKGYTEPSYIYNSPYTKVTYKDGNIVSGHTGGYLAGNSLLITGDIAQISIAPKDNKVFYDMDNGERTVTYKMNPVLNFSSANRESQTTDFKDNVYITATLPKDLHYKQGTCLLEPSSVKENENGTTTLKWNLKDVKVGDSISPITFDCKIGEAGTKTDVVNGQQIKVQAKISSDYDQRKSDSTYGNLAETSISIIKLATSSIAKTVDKELNEIGGDFTFTLNMGNTSDIDVKKARLYDVMPFNGDERGSKYHGAYRITSVTLDYKDAPKTFATNKSKAYIQTTNDARYQTDSDYQNILNYTGLDSWNKLSNGVINEGNKTITFAVNSSDIKALFIDFGGDLQGNEFVKASVKCSPLGTDGKLMKAEDGSTQLADDVYVNSFYEYATDQIAVVQSNIVKTTVMDRSLSGLVWNDKNKNGIQDKSESSLSGKKIVLYRTTPSSKGSDKNSVKIAGKTLYPAYTTIGDKIAPVVTKEDGKYEFNQLEAGTYIAVLNGKILQYTVTDKKQGSDTTVDSDASAGDMDSDKPENAVTDEISLVDSWKSEHNDFGLYTTMSAPVEITKQWDDKGNTEGFRPLKIQVDIKGSDGSSRTESVDIYSNWKKTINNLPKYDENGYAIKYIFTEQSDANYTGQAVNDSGKITFKNVRQIEKTSVKVKKVWNDDNNRDGIRPNKVAVELLANGEVVEEYDGLNESNNWTYTFDNLNKYKNGKEIEYTVREKDKIQNYTVSYENKDNTWTVTNTHTPEKIQLKINKVWDDNENQDGIRPDSVNIELDANGKKLKDISLTKENGWSISLDDLFKYENGKEITYEVKEVSDVKGYTSKITNKSNTYTITNSHAPSKISVSGTKKWDDNENQDGIRPDSVTIHLLVDGKEISKKSVSVKDNWKYEFTDLDEYKNGQKINYTVEEDSVEGYSTAYDKFDITNTHNPEKTSVTVRKVWDDNQNQDGIRTDTVNVELFADGVDTGKSVTLNNKNSWQASFTDLDKNQNGKEVEYTVQELSVPEGYDSEIEKDKNGIFVITNKHVPATTFLSVSKVWNDDNNRDGIRPDKIHITLYENGEKADEKDITESDGWQQLFENLPVYESGEKIVYSIIEDNIDGYTSNITQNGDAFTVENTHEPEKISLKIHKEWDDKNDADGLRPDSVKVHLFANGDEVGVYEIKKDDDWDLTIQDLCKYENGKEIKYTISENDISGYTSKILIPEQDDESNAGSGYDFIIQNTHKVSPKPVKAKDSTPPAQVTVSTDKIQTGVSIGDSLWVILAGVCAGCLMEFAIYRTKRTRR